MKKLKLFNKNFQTSSEILLYDQIEVKWQSFNCQQSTVGRFEKTIIAFNYIRKILQLKLSTGFCIYVGFEICQGSEYYKILNLPGL